MSEYTDLIEFLKLQQEERKLQRLLEEKGYANSQNEYFGLNQWTNRLIVMHPDMQSEIDDQEKPPDHLVSFLSIPACWREESLDINENDFQQWVSGYQWKNIPGMNYPSIQGRIQACSEGLLLPHWIESSRKDGLEAFLLIRRDGICEYGMGKNAYYFFEKNTIFQFIQIVGRLWQFLLFINDLHVSFLKDKNPEVKIIVNLRGTKNALLGNLGEGWNDPLSHSFNTYRPKCNDNNIQIQRKISSGFTANDIQEIIHWFATRIDNAWGQFDPRCYVSKQFDETTPFAFRIQK